MDTILFIRLVKLLVTFFAYPVCISTVLTNYRIIVTYVTLVNLNENTVATKSLMFQGKQSSLV